MVESLSVTVEQRRSGARLIKLEGALDDTDRLRELGNRIDSGAALVNLAGVERIDDAGIAAWMEWLAILDAKGIRPALIACSPAIVAELNRDESFAGNAVVKSFYVPYGCMQCEEEKLQLIHLVDLGSQPRDVPACSCDACGMPMVCTDDPAQYLAFVRRIQSAAAAAAAAANRAPKLARGSSSSVSSEPSIRPSAPRLRTPSAAPQSTFQVFERTRPSAHDISLAAPVTLKELRYIVALLVVLLGSVAVFVYLL